MGIFDHLKHLIKDEIYGGHHRRGHHGGHHYEEHHYDVHHDPYYDPNCVQPQQQRRPVPPRSATPPPCPKCGRFNPSHVLFCQQCGWSLAGDGANIACAGCGAELPPDARFCSECGRQQ